MFFSFPPAAYRGCTIAGSSNSQHCCVLIGYVDILKMWLSWCLTLIITHSHIIFSEPNITMFCLKTIEIIHVYVLSSSDTKRYGDNSISFFLSKRTLNLFLASLSFLSIPQTFRKLGQTSDTKLSRRSVWLWGDCRHWGGSSGRWQLVHSAAYQNVYV